MIRLQMVVPVLLGLTLGTAAHAAVPTTVPSPTLSQVAKCDSAALTLNLVNGKPMTLKQARRIPVGRAFTVPAAGKHVTRIMREGDNPWTLCREELAQRVQTAAATVTVLEPPSPASTTKPIVRLEKETGRASTTFVPSLPPFDAVPLVPVTQETLPTPPAVTVPRTTTPLVAAPQEKLPAPTPRSSNQDTTPFSSTMPGVQTGSSHFWSSWDSEELRNMAVLLAALLLACLIWIRLYSRREAPGVPQNKLVTTSAELSGVAVSATLRKAEERAPVPQGLVAISFCFEFPGLPHVPFVVLGAVDPTIITDFASGTQHQTYAIKGHGPWCDGLSERDRGDTVRVATFSLTRRALTYECEALTRQIRHAIAKNNVKPTNLDKAIREWLEVGGIDWTKIEERTSHHRDAILFPAKHRSFEAA